MRHDRRLAAALHALMHLAERPMTSAELAACTGTHAPLVRRTLAGLREAGLLVSGKGHGGGWRLARPASQVSVRAVHEALGAPALLAAGLPDHAGHCRSQDAVSDLLAEAFAEAERALAERLDRLTLAELASRRDEALSHAHREERGAA